MTPARSSSPSLSNQKATTRVTRMSRRMVTVEETTLSSSPATRPETSLLTFEDTELPLSWMPCAASWVRAELTMLLTLLINVGPCLLSCDASLTIGVAIR